MSQRTFQIYFYDSVTDHSISHNKTWLKIFCSSECIFGVSRKMGMTGQQQELP